MIYFNDYFIRNPIWSSLIHFGQSWFNLVKKWIKLKIWWYISIIVSSKIQFDQVRSILIPFGEIWVNQKKIKLKIWRYISMIISSYIQFDQVWSILINFGQIWFNLIKKWKSDDIFQWLFHQKLKMWKKWKIWLKRLQKREKHFKRFSLGRELKIRWYISMIISSEIQFDQVWSILIYFGQIWFNLIKK